MNPGKNSIAAPLQERISTIRYLLIQLILNQMTMDNDMVTKLKQPDGHKIIKLMLAYGL